MHGSTGGGNSGKRVRKLPPMNTKVFSDRKGMTGLMRPDSPIIGLHQIDAHRSLADTNASVEIALAPSKDEGAVA
ncbi:hypothetical protein PAAG_12231 [Paracoccidioides lutzii Pb01]|uniref:Uncharacterized protein n=1 Tax=Paracoccidioides lutzii (strain ATCC MYA-826 / Pb01) TaxID=502779 RepID=A0A0A2V0S7_PARBA|nr:hypothetical protein PAAG_12231 [Paracoccidioides lutzii Pb01]KGQ01103.1 hypothetical protein PAAG_12231 [Paracoccidioides lutzii Pb01]